MGKQKEEEEASACTASLSVQRGQVNQKAFTRLYEDGELRKLKINSRRNRNEQNEAEMLEAASVHRNAAGDGQVFQRLHSTKNSHLKAEPGSHQESLVVANQIIEDLESPRPSARARRPKQMPKPVMPTPVMEPPQWLLEEDWCKRSRDARLCRALIVTLQKQGVQPNRDGLSRSATLPLEDCRNYDRNAAGDGNSHSKAELGSHQESSSVVNQSFDDLESPRPSLRRPKKMPAPNVELPKWLLEEDWCKRSKDARSCRALCATFENRGRQLHRDG